MSIKPVAWLSKANADRLRSDSTATVIPYNWGIIGDEEDFAKLYAIPDTHRVVPVEVLQATMTGAYPFELKLCEKIRALIEDKP
jgi:hypothetical protein